MGTLALLGAWILSVLPFFAETLSGGALAVEGASRFGLALLPWAALAGLPPPPVDSARARGPALALGLALPPLGLGLGLDAARGASLFTLATAAAAGLLILVLFLLAARAARRSVRARRVHALLWFLVVPLAAALWLALSWAAGASADASETLPLAARFAPLVWIHGWTAAGGSPPTPLAALPTVAVLVGVLSATWAAGKSPTPSATEGHP